MKISIIGTGYVGAVTGICLAGLGHRITFVDIDGKKLAAIRAGTPPVYEPQLAGLLRKNQDRIMATRDLTQAVATTDLTMITVGTPSLPDGSIDLSFITAAARDLGAALSAKKGFHTVVVKSTVLPGTTDGIVRPLLEKGSGKAAAAGFGLASNPEFLREGSAVEDFIHSDRIVIGANDDRSRAVLESIYASFDCPKIVTDIKTAEMIKYVSNAFLATKVSFANEIGNICKTLGIDTYEVFRGVGMDSRIGPAFFRSGIGFGGSCFPKDLRALIAMARAERIEPALLCSVMAINDSQPARMLALLKKHVPLKGSTIGVLGLAFKPDTDDIRESRAIPIIEELLRQGCRVVAHDPVAMEQFRAIFPGISYAENPGEVLRADAVLIVTEWEVFNTLDYRNAVVIDGRRLEKAAREARVYEGVCW